ncbi:transcription factor IIF subunit tfg1 [Dimargaris cristalligena]|uniref:Transcription initiation factor IIF subunit alpha n=1 Tax=Dimargaris cristalligena TaxID=215637 RepID=A0A4V1J5I2_9FUNG|nr:transcription factor IIF subunit tfg1 [Dimargaris cristalligena]RKP39149.1 hypothetical protein BJ085DRAFT_41260 [Dimargaris cristalligena]|eukprot:RKP39149.1 hypothetical protein BJ085DRAFT_41260 [Dimargaris cristalligena]
MNRPSVPSAQPPVKREPGAGLPRRPAPPKVPSFLRPSKPSILPGGATQARGPQASANSRRPHPAAPGARPQAPPAPRAPAAATPAVPERGYTDYRLVSSTKSDETHYIMRFQSNKQVKPEEFTPPLKLRRRDRATIQQFVKASLPPLPGGPGDDAGTSAAAPEPTPTYPLRGSSGPTAKVDTSLIAPHGGAIRNKQMLFKKRTKQIFLADEKMRKLREVESKPWLLEDFDHQELWTGSLEGGQKSSYVMFVLIEDGFKIIPADKWYKFHPKLQYATLSIDEAEDELKRSQKEESDRWIMQRRTARPDAENGGASSAKSGGVARLKNMINTDHDPNVEDFASFDMRTVDASVLDQESDGEGPGGGNRRGGGGNRSDGDEIDFEEDFQDDEEGGGELEVMDDETKEAKEREKGRLQKFSAVTVNDDEDQEDEFEDVDNADTSDKLDENGKELKNLVRDLEKNKAYESDQEDDPYASDDDLFEEVETPADSAASGAANSPATPATVDSAGGGGSNAATPSNAAAKKRKRAPTAAVAATPSASTKPSKSASLGAAKVKTEPGRAVGGGGEITSTPDAKKARKVSVNPTAAAAATDSLLLTEQDIINLLRNQSLEAKEMIAILKPKLKAHPDNALRFKQFVRNVAVSHNKIYTLKDEFR